MKIEHSALLNDFLSFYFETTVDGRTLYVTILDYSTHRWYTRALANPEVCILSGSLNRHGSRDEELAEVHGIREAVTAHLQG